MFNIIFTKNGRKDCTEVIAKIDTGLGRNIERPILSFSFNCAYQYVAELLQRFLEESLDEAITDAHRRAYEQGWEDHRKKRRKKKEFSCIFTEREIGW